MEQKNKKGKRKDNLVSKQVYISADYACDGDRDVAEVLQKWGKDSIGFMVKKMFVFLF